METARKEEVARANRAFQSVVETMTKAGVETPHRIEEERGQIRMASSQEHGDDYDFAWWVDHGDLETGPSTVIISMVFAPLPGSPEVPDVSLCYIAAKDVWYRHASIDGVPTEDSALMDATILSEQISLLVSAHKLAHSQDPPMPAQAGASF
ncbi:MAG: hypothetical protein WC787_03665 [Patescibacteria group bacterium]|jgi:hypothetical protein